jgi:hypothetical protein
MRRLSGAGLVLLFSMGCSSSDSGSTSRADASAEPSAAAGATIAAGGTITGTVLEQIPVEPYVYLRLDTPNGELWTAVAQAPVTVGAPVTVYNALPMAQFESATLQRTFALIYFGALEPPGGDGFGANADVNPNANANAGSAPASMGAPVPANANVGRIAPATGDNARTIGDLWLQMDRLAGRAVSVRGVVVKYNGGVMGKNWIHLQDGTGEAGIGTHDLAVTTLDSAAVGDTITITGTVRTRVDVGAGYSYLLLLEDGRVGGRQS